MRVKKEMVLREERKRKETTTEICDYVGQRRAIKRPPIRRQNCSSVISHRSTRGTVKRGWSRQTTWRGK
jgi:hypothetical protein